MFKLSDIGRKTILLVYFLVGLIAVIALIAEQNREQTEWDSEEFWLKFNKSPDVFVTVGQVTFQDGSQWVAGERERVK